MAEERTMEILNNLIDYLVEAEGLGEAIRIMRECCGVTNYELIHDFSFGKNDVMKGE